MKIARINLKTEVSHRDLLEKVMNGLIALFIFTTMLSASLLPFAVSGLAIVSGKISLICRIFMLLIAIVLRPRLSMHSICLFVIFVFSYLSISSYAWGLFDLVFLSIFYCPKDYTKTLKIYIGSIVLGFIVIFALYFLHKMPEYQLLRDDGTPRYSFGFSHPNGLGRCTLLLCCMFYFLKRTCFTWKHIFLYFVIGLFIYYFPNSVTSTLLVWLIAAVMLFQKAYLYQNNKNPLSNQWIRMVGYTLLPVSIILVIVITVIYINGASIVENLPTTILSRFKLGTEGLQRYGIKLFGNDIKFTTTADIYFQGHVGRYFVLDSLFFYLPIRVGLVPTVYFAAIYFYTICNCVRKKDMSKLVVLIIFLLYSMSESAMISSTAFLYSFIFINPNNRDSLLIDLENQNILIPPPKAKIRRKYVKIKY